MCKEDPCKHILRLDEPIAQAADEADWNTTESPATPTGPTVTKPPPLDVSGGSAVSGGDSTGTNTAIFFARVPPMVPYDELLVLFNKFGAVKDLNLFRCWATANTSKGCGTVQYSKPEEASAAMLALNGVYTFEGFPGCEGPMVVEWMDASRLTAPSDAAAAHKGGKATSTSKPPAKSLQHKPRHKNTTNGAGGLPAWQYMQHLNAIHTRALAAAAAAAAGGCNLGPSASFPGLHPAVEALDVCALLSTPLTDSCSSNLGAGLADPTSWGSVIPVHLLPMMGQQQVTQGNFGVNAQPGVSPLLPPGAAAMSNMSLWMEPSAQLLPEPCGDSSSGLDMLTGANSGVFGCPTPGAEPWLPAGLPARSDSTSSSFTPMMPAAFAPSSRSFLAAAAAEQQAQQQLRPLMVLESPWGPRGCDTLASAATNTAPGPLNSGSYALYDAALVNQLHEAAAAEVPLSLGASGNIHSSNSALAGPGVSLCWGCWWQPGRYNGVPFGMPEQLLTGDCRLSGFLNTPCAGVSAAEAGRPGALSLSSDEGYLNMQASTQTPQQARQDTALTTLQIPLSDSCLSQLALTIPHIAKMSGAELQMTVSPSGMELRLQGAATEVEAARNLMHLLSPGASPGA